MYPTAIAPVLTESSTGFGSRFNGLQLPPPHEPLCGGEESKSRFGRPDGQVGDWLADPRSDRIASARSSRSRSAGLKIRNSGDGESRCASLGGSGFDLDGRSLMAVSFDTHKISAWRSIRCLVSFCILYAGNWESVRLPSRKSPKSFGGAAIGGDPLSTQLAPKTII